MPNVLFTQLGIWNDAAYKVGSKRFVAGDISAPASSNNPAALYLSDLWPFIVQEILEEHPWSFAVNTVPLVPLNPPAWLTSTSYSVGAYVLQGGAIYVCLVAHTSNVFATDIAAGDWAVQEDQSNVNIAPLLLPLPAMNYCCVNPYALPLDFVKPYLFSAPGFYRLEVIKPPYIAVAKQVMLINNPNVAVMKYVFNQTDYTQWAAKACNALSTRATQKLCFKISEAAQYAAAMIKQYDTDLISAISNDSNNTSADEAIADGWFIARLNGSTGAVGVGPDNNNVGWGIPGLGF
jgi:hypothetical protein